MQEVKTLFQRMRDVMQDIEYLTKDDEVSTGRSSYRAVTEEKVTTAVRASLIKNGIIIIPVEQEHSRVDETVKAWNKFEKRDEEKINRITTVNTKYRIQNVDDPADFIIAASSGTGVDTQDKGVGKAMTYAFKYLLLRTFAIPTGDDPDKISSDLYTDKLTGAADKAKEAAKEKYKPNVNEPTEKTSAELRTDIYALGLSKGTPREKMDEWVLSKRGKALAQMSYNELTALYAALNK